MVFMCTVVSAAGTGLEWVSRVLESPVWPGFRLKCSSENPDQDRKYGDIMVERTFLGVYVKNESLGFYRHRLLRNEPPSLCAKSSPGSKLALRKVLTGRKIICE